MNRVVSVASVAVSLVAVIAFPAVAEFDDGYWYLNFSSSSAPARPLRVGVAEAGHGFGFVTMSDDNGDGMIELPLVPVGGRLALGVDYGDGEEDCDIYDFIGPGVVGLDVVVPLLTNAAMGESVGINFGALMAPPLLLTPGDRFTVANGVLPAWPSLRFVDESGVPDLESFVRDVDTLPAFSGDVVVSGETLRFTFVPEPSTLVLLMLAAASIHLRVRRIA